MLNLGDLQRQLNPDYDDTSFSFKKRKLDQVELQSKFTQNVKDQLDQPEE